MTEIGTVIHGTHRNEDILPALLDVLEIELAADQFRQIQIAAKRAKAQGWMDEFIWENLFDAMNDIAPKDCYFGAHEGDGSDFGFWKICDDF
jgi:hypothetical protein